MILKGINYFFLFIIKHNMQITRYYKTTYNSKWINVRFSIRINEISIKTFLVRFECTFKTSYKSSKIFANVSLLWTPFIRPCGGRRTTTCTRFSQERYESRNSLANETVNAPNLTAFKKSLPSDQGQTKRC